MNENRNRNRTRTLAAGLLATVIGLGIASPAMANPVLTTSMGMVPTDGTVGESFDMMASGCFNPDGDAYFGGYIEGQDGFYAELITGDGTWSQHVVLENPGTYVLHSFCSTGPVTSDTDPNMLWVSPAYTFTMSAADVQAHAARKVARTAPSAQALTVDRDSAPVVDRMGMPGAQASALKDKVDAQVTTVGQVSRLFQTFFGRPASSADLKEWTAKLDKRTTPAKIAAKFATSTEFKKLYNKLSDAQFVDAVTRNAVGHDADPQTRSTVAAKLRRGRVSRAQVALDIANSPEMRSGSDDADYVVTAYKVLAKRAPSAAELSTGLNSLENTLATRVEVVEDIALATARR